MKTRMPEISLVLPCYNEEVALRETVPELARTFSADGINLELVLVNNGSTDNTEEIMDGLIERGYPIKKLSFEKNQGYGGGIIEGLKICSAPVVGYLCADGQVSAEDALMAFRLIKGREERTLTKVRRRFREDSWKRKIVSIIYNGLMQILYGGLGAIDINGSPKILSREVLEKMDLRSRDWFLDPEIIIKAKYLGLRIIEVDVEGNPRKGGASNVNLGTCLEFIINLARYKFGHTLDQWRKEIKHVEKQPTRLKQAQLQSSIPRSDITVHSSGKDRDLFDEVRVVEQKRFDDSRGSLLKVLSASQNRGSLLQGEIYVTSALPGESKGNHYHLEMGEWFSIVQGIGEVDIWDTESGKKMAISLDALRPRTVFVPAGLAHSITNKGHDLLICVACAEKEHDPNDVYPAR